MNVIKSIIAFFVGTLLGMYGGQKNKAARRYALPITVLGYCISIGWEWRYLAFLGFIPVLIMGYGVDSILGAVCFHAEWLIRFAYAVLLSIPFVVFGLLRWIVAAIVLIVAFQIHAGSLGNIPNFGDVLVEDIIRYGSLMLLVIVNVTVKKKQ